MANEITGSGKLTLDIGDGNPITVAYSFSDTPSSKKFIYTRQTIGITEEAIQLGEVSSLGWGIVVNLDPTNFVTIRLPGTGASNDGIKLKPKDSDGNYFGAGPFLFGPDVTAPYAIADTAACDIKFLICSQ